MLEPEYFNDKADRMIEIYQQLEEFILKDIAGRLMKAQSVSGTADRMMWKLEQMGESRSEIMNKLAKLTGLSRRELKALLQDAVMTSWSDDLSVFNQLGIQVVNPLENPAVMSVMDAEYKKCQGELENLTKTTIDQSQQDLLRMLDEAEVRVASGVQSYSSAVCEILDNYAGKGMLIDYPTGARRSLEAAVRMCVVTSMNQTTAQITNQYIVEGDIKYVLVSAHLGARTQQPGQPYLAGHENWQGKVYCIQGSEPDCPNLAEMTGYNIDESGKGKVINPLGLHGYNCRHSHKPWDKRLRNPYVDRNGNPVIDSEESRKHYENQQKQRAMERAIRRTKRELLMKQEEINMVAEVDIKEMLHPAYDKLSYKLRQQNAAYNKFCEENGLQKQSDRLKVAGFKREQAEKSSGRARAYKSWNEAKVNVVESDSGIAKRIRRIFGKGDVLDKFYDELEKVKNRDVKVLLKQSAERVKIDSTEERKSRYIPKQKQVIIGKDATPGTVAHELFHEIDSTYGLTENGFLHDSLISDYKKLESLSIGYGKNVVEMLYSRYPKAFYINEKQQYRMHEEYRGISDILHGLSNTDIFLGYGHSRPHYWEGKYAIEREAFSQYGRILFEQNEEVLKMISEIFPNSTDEVLERLKGVIK